MITKERLDYIQQQLLEHTQHTTGHYEIYGLMQDLIDELAIVMEGET